MPSRFVRAAGLVPLAAALLGAGTFSAARAGTASAPRRAAVQTVPAALPFGPGERSTYQVKLAGVSVGRGTLEVTGVEVVDGNNTLHARMTINGGVPLARVDDKYETWFDRDELFSRRFKQDIHEVRYRRNRSYDFSPERRTWRRENGETGPLATDKPLDDLSFLFYARTLTFSVGDTFTLNRYFRESGNPVTLRVVRRETVKVPAGTYKTIVVRPTIHTNGLFGQGGQAEVYFTDDARHIVVMVKSRVPVVGSLTMQLQTYTPGH
ncbi:MAG TPA: DUF3108 domain-containing protein [Longimicrobiaceae bacterium]|jgi:hypothetical protein|nr:DUF3108 domain-containing protein [Longimicrobiaceae bacterium]